MQDITPVKYQKEKRKLTGIYLNSELSWQEIVEQNATDEYKEYYKQEKRRREGLRAKGIIVN